MTTKLASYRPLVPAILKVYSAPGGGAGCCLHIVTDDDNTQDDDAAWVLGLAFAAEHPLCLEAAALLVRASRTQRIKAIAVSRKALYENVAYVTLRATLC